VLSSAARSQLSEASLANTGERAIVCRASLFSRDGMTVEVARGMTAITKKTNASALGSIMLLAMPLQTTACIAAVDTANEDVAQQQQRDSTRGCPSETCPPEAIVPTFHSGSPCPQCTEPALERLFVPEAVVRVRDTTLASQGPASKSSLARP
jgi:hypothetical protein